MTPPLAALVAFATALASAGLAPLAVAAAPTGCEAVAATACYVGFEPAGAGGRLNYYASRRPGSGPSSAAPTSALIAVHGHPRDATKTFDAALLAVQRAGRLGDTLVVAPVFQVDSARAANCRTDGVPAAQPGDLLWTCSSWPEGESASNGAGLASFAALDALVAELARQWPTLRTVTIAGFSAGAQMVQRAIGFAAAPPAGVALRYVVADPGSWLYFDAFRPQPVGVSSCPAANRWKYGTEALPPHLGRNAAQARAQYAAADIHYLEGERDSNDAKGMAHRLLDTSCAAAAQGEFRLQRGLAYADYDRALLAPSKQRQVTVVPGCAHDVACVFPSAAAREALFGAGR